VNATSADFLPTPNNKIFTFDQYQPTTEISNTITQYNLLPAYNKPNIKIADQLQTPSITYSRIWPPDRRLLLPTSTFADFSRLLKISTNLFIIFFTFYADFSLPISSPDDTESNQDHRCLSLLHADLATDYSLDDRFDWGQSKFQ
jgi:hypothetical protein